MAKWEGTFAVNAPVEKVFAYIHDPTSIAEWLPSAMETKDVSVTEEGVGTHFRWVGKMAGLPFEGEGTTIEYIPNRRIVTQTKGGIVMTWSWTFESHDDATKVNLVVEYTIPVPLLGKLAEAFVLRQQEREGDLMIANIKARMEG